MNKLTRTGIEYGDYGWTFYPGCLHKPQGKCLIEHCWAEGMRKRQVGAAAKKGITLPDFHHPHLIPERLLAPLSVKKPSRILVNFMGDLFGDWVDPNMTCPEFVSDVGDGPMRFNPNGNFKKAIFDVVDLCSQHTFIFLTKNPQGLLPWSPFPRNCYIGVSVTNQEAYETAIKYLSQIEAGGKFLSLEPLLERIVI